MQTEESIKGNGKIIFDSIHTAGMEFVLNHTVNMFTKAEIVAAIHMFGDTSAKVYMSREKLIAKLSNVVGKK